MLCRCRPYAKPACRGFTLAEVLAAMLFMAIVIPVAVEGLRVASRAGEFGMRKMVAARVAERLLNELVVNGQSAQTGQSGVVEEGLLQYRWTSTMEPWTLGPLRLVTVAVTYPVQGEQYELRLSTLVDSTR